MNVLVSGWFSFKDMGATAGDILARDIVCVWLKEAGIDYRIATAYPFSGGSDWNSLDPSRFTHIIFVCGPFGNGWPITDFLKKFERIPLIGINVSLLQPLDKWNPFEVLFERDSSKRVNPDIVFMTHAPKVPVVGLVLVHHQKEYGKDARHEEVNDHIRRFLAETHSAVVQIDTRLDANAYGLRNEREIETLIARMDIIVTTRLHGMVLALKNNVPPLAIDPIHGGAKITKQAVAIDWPAVISSDACSKESLQRGWEYCFSKAGRLAVEHSRNTALKKGAEIKRAFLNQMQEFYKKEK